MDEVRSDVVCQLGEEGLGGELSEWSCNVKFNPHLGFGFCERTHCRVMPVSTRSCSLDVVRTDSREIGVRSKKIQTSSRREGSI